MRIKKKNVARLASLSALGAGALGIGAGTAEAGIVYTPVDVTVGFDYGDFANVITERFPGGATFKLSRAAGTNRYGSKTTICHTVNLRGNTSTGKSLIFKNGNAAFGKTWNTFPGIGPLGPALGTRRLIWWAGSGPTITDSGTNGDFYKLFAFETPGRISFSYGWAYFSENVGPLTGPAVTLLGMAYDDSGATIAAGNMGPPAPSVPEPSTMAMTGLAALVLGAVGLRRWRAAR